MISQVVSLAFMCFLNFWDRPIFKEVMHIYVMQSQSFCEDTYVTPEGIWSWDWPVIHPWQRWSWWCQYSTEKCIPDSHLPFVYIVILSISPLWRTGDTNSLGKISKILFWIVMPTLRKSCHRPWLQGLKTKAKLDPWANLLDLRTNHAPTPHLHLQPHQTRHRSLLPS